MLNSTANSTDKRRGLRKSAIQEQICVVELAGDRSAMLLDVSELGIGVQSVEGALSRSQTPVRFVLPGGSTIISGEGQVAWSDQTGCMGIRFTSLAPQMMEEIRKWINTDSNPLFEDPAEEESAVQMDARDRVAQLEARIMVSGWAQVQALNFLVDQVAAMTQAGGVAIAVEDGNGIVCKASSGIAPQVGVRVNSRSGLSWECVRTGELVHCVDTETDPRVDRMVCRQLNMRSAMLVPVTRDGRISGLVEVFSSRAHAFNANTVILLKSVAEAVGGLDEHLAPALEPLLPSPEKPKPVAPQVGKPLAPSPAAPALVNAAAARTAPASTPVVAKPAAIADSKPPASRPAPLEFPKPVRDVVPADAPKPAAAAKTPAVVTPSRPVPTVTVSKPAIAGPAAAAAAAAAPAVAPAPQKPAEKPREATIEKAPAPVVEKPREAAVPKPRETTQPAAVVVAPAVRPAPKLTAVEEEPLPELFRETESSDRSGLVLKVGVGIAAAAVCAGLTFGGLYWAHSGKNTNSPAQAAPKTAAVTPAPVPPVVEPSGTSIPVGAPISGGTVHSEAARTPATDASKSQPGPTNLEVAESAVPVRVATARPTRTEVAPVSASPLPITTQSAAGVSSILSTSVAVPTLVRARVSQGVTGGKQIRRVDPRYPPNARSLRLNGTVVVVAHVSKTGTVSSVDIVSGSPMLAAAAAEAVRQWRYEPFLLDGQPIENSITVQVKFSQPQ